MKFISAFIFFLNAVSVQAQTTFRLAAPYIKYNTIFFDKELSIPLAFEQPGAEIRYTVDNTPPHSKSKRYQKPISIKSNTITIKARSFAKGYAPSKVEEATFIKTGKPITVSFPPPGGNYRGAGPNTLTDNNGGITDHHNSFWLGYNIDSVTLTIDVDSSQPIKEILFNVLQNQDAWIFFPSKAAVYVLNGTETNTWRLLHTAAIPVSKSDAVVCRAFRLPLHHVKSNQVKLVLSNTLLPAWHQGAGYNGWMFIDEIKVY